MGLLGLPTARSKMLFGAGIWTLLFLVPGILKAQTSICDAIAGNLVQNCGFETGSFTDWETTPAAFESNFGVAEFEVNSGNFGAFFAATGTLDDSISQTLSTVPGDSYELSFYLHNHGSGPGVADFYAYWDGVEIFDASDLVFPYTEFSFTVRGTSSDTLEFAGLQNPSEYILDDVSVTLAPTPEPASMPLFGTGMLSIFIVMLFSRGQKPWRGRRL